MPIMNGEHMSKLIYLMPVEVIMLCEHSPWMTHLICRALTPQDSGSVRKAQQQNS